MSADKMAVHFSSATDNWATPQDFFAKLNAEFAFELDVCADAQNAKCARFFDRVANGLSQEWTGICWMNPPYGREIGAWIKKAYQSSLQGATVVCLIPARTDTSWWHDYCVKGEVRFVRGRLKFGGSKNSAPFPNAVIVFRPAVMRLVIIESPYAGEIALNVEYARAAVRDSLARGEAPIASHLLYTKPGVLNDEIPEERKQGIDAGLAWRHVSSATVVYADRGISRGMEYGIAAARAAGKPVEFRSLEAFAATRIMEIEE